MCKFPLTGCLQIICKNVFAKLVQSVFQKAESYQKLTTENGSKQRFSLWGGQTDPPPSPAGIGLNVTHILFKEECTFYVFESR